MRRPLRLRDRLRAALRALLGPEPENTRDLTRAVRELTEEVKRLQAQAERRTIQIDRVEQMTVESLFHVIGRLEVDQLDGTLNVGISRNLRVQPRLPEAPKPPAGPHSL